MKCPICKKEIENSKFELEKHLESQHSNGLNVKNNLNIPKPENSKLKTSFWDYVNIVD